MNPTFWIVVALAIAFIIFRRVVLPMMSRRAEQKGPRRRVIKNRRYVAFKGLTVASLKMYFRNRTAIFFSLFFPMVFITVFGLIFKNNGRTFKIDVNKETQSTMEEKLEK